LRAKAADLGYEQSSSGQWVWISEVIGPSVDWELQVEDDGSGDQQWVLVETIALPVTWLWALLAASLLALFWVYLPVALFFWLLVLVPYVGVSVAFLFIRSPLDRYLDWIRSQEEATTVLDANDYKTSCVGPAMTAMLSGLVSSGPLFLAGVPLLLGQIQSSPFVALEAMGTWATVLVFGGVWMGAFWVVGLSVGALIYLYEDDDIQIRVFPFDVLGRLNLPIPELSGGYVTLVLAAIVPLVALVHSSFLLPVFNHLNTTRLALYFLAPPTFIVLSVIVFLYWWAVRNRTYVYERTIERLEDRQTRAAKLRAMAVIIGMSYVLVYSIAAYLEKFQAYLVWPIVNWNPTPVADSPLLVGLLVLAALPAAYFVVGIGYQLVGFVAGLTTVVTGSRAVGSTERMDATLRVVAREKPQAHALKLGPWSAVFVSKGMVDLFADDATDGLPDDPGFDALVAHEEAHLDPTANDAWLADATVSVLAPVVGLLTFSGKNVVYALLDFRERERAADRYAADAESPDDLGRALERLRETMGGRGTPASVPFAPSASPVEFVPAARPSSLAGAFEKYFGLLFGSFALVQSHPDIDERIDALGLDPDGQ
jgi:Zn-dependent protease with chaperone function